METKLNIKDEIAVYNDLKSLGCCNRCILHFVNGFFARDNYNNPQTYFETLGINVGNDDLERQAKKFKENPCRACLNILQDAKLDDFADAVCKSQVMKYDCNDFNICISFPKSILIRNHAIHIYLKNKYTEFFQGQRLVEFKKIFRYSIKDKLANILNKTFSLNSNLEITICLDYVNDNDEVNNITRLAPDKFKKKRFQRRDTPISKVCISDVLQEVDDGLFMKYFAVPPRIPVLEAYLTEVTCWSAPYYLGGRYMKYSRDIGQTPWIINNQKITEHCVQDFIFAAVRNVLGEEVNLTFTASGREDSDVRMLGNGRPFYIQIDNPTYQNISPAQCRAIENHVREQTACVAVCRLRPVHKTSLSLIKDGEESKSKTYVALCQTTATDIKGTIDAINLYGHVELAQKTPLRVLHRRTAMVRKRNIYSMHAKEVPGHSDLFELQCVTQAGTYVKEFVNGDFERTLPNLGGITGSPVDIVALDVTSIDLNWPDAADDL